MVQFWTSDLAAFKGFSTINARAENITHLAHLPVICHRMGSLSEICAIDICNQSHSNSKFGMGVTEVVDIETQARG